MKIVVCGSMSASLQMVDTKNKLEKMGYNVLLPRHSEKYASGEFTEETKEESAKNKIKDDLIRDYFKEISRGDALLIVNVAKKGIENYIGGNAFLEMGFAHVLNKTIYVLNEIPDMTYSSEIIAMQPIVLRGDLKRITATDEN